MIIFGIQSAKLKATQTKPYDCIYCKTEKSVWFYYFQKYIHIFWIPVIPIGKTGSSVCNHCKQVLSANEMPDFQKRKFLEEKAEIKTPIGYKIALFLFLALLSLPILLGIYQKLTNQ